MQGGPRCIWRNVDPKRHSASCRVDQWSCPPQLWPCGLDSQKMISNLQVHEAVAPDQLPHQESGCDSRQMEWCWDGTGNSGRPTAFSKYHLIWAGPKGSALPYVRVEVKVTDCPGSRHPLTQTGHLPFCRWTSLFTKEHIFSLQNLNVKLISTSSPSLKCCSIFALQRWQNIQKASVRVRCLKIHKWKWWTFL